MCALALQAAPQGQQLQGHVSDVRVLRTISEALERANRRTASCKQLRAKDRSSQFVHHSTGFATSSTRLWPLVLRPAGVGGACARLGGAQAEAGGGVLAPLRQWCLRPPPLRHICANTTPAAGADPMLHVSE